MSDAAIAYEDDDGIVRYRASSVGRCPRALFASRLGMTPIDPPSDMQARFDDGHLHEGAVRQKMLDAGIQVVDDQSEIIVPITPRLLIVGHHDGIVSNLGDWSAIAPDLGPVPNLAVLEIKSMAQSSFEKWQLHGFDAFPNYATQIALYMEALSMPAVYAVKNKNSGQMAWRLLDELPADLAAIKRKIVGVEQAVRDNVMPDCGPVDWPCPFFYLHDEEVRTGPAKDQIEVRDDPALDALAVNYTKAKGEESRAKAAKDRAREALMHHIGTGKVATEQWTVNVVEKNRARLDADRLFEDHPELSRDMYTTKTPYREVRVAETETD